MAEENKQPKRLDEIVEQPPARFYFPTDTRHALHMKNLIAGRWAFPIDWNRAWKRLDRLTDQNVEDTFVAYYNHMGAEVEQIDDSPAEQRKILEDILDTVQNGIGEPEELDIYCEADPLCWSLDNGQQEEAECVTPLQIPVNFHEAAFLLSLAGLTHAARLRVRGHNIPSTFHNIARNIDEEYDGPLFYYPERGSQDAPMPLQWNPAEAIARSVLADYQFEADAADDDKAGEPASGNTTDN